MQTPDLETIQGLSIQEAHKRLKAEGPNEISQKKKRTLLHVIADVLKEPMLSMLLVGGILYLFLGNIDEALLLLFCELLVIGITVYQEERTEHALEALRTLSNPDATVIRDGKQHRIPGREVVRGDTVVIEEGERVPADSYMIISNNLEVDESILTGESIPLPKYPTDHDNTAIPKESLVYSGTIVTQGYGIAIVTATGNHTEIGKIGRSLDTIKPSRSLLKREMQKVVVKLTAYGMVMCALIILLYGLTRGDWIRGLLSGLALAMSMLPEEFPVILTIFLALGGARLSQRKVLARRVQTLEMLGAANILCVDKTGTLTQNRLLVSRLLPFTGEVKEVGDEDSIRKLPPTYQRLAYAAYMACRPNHPDPLEQAVRESFANLFPLTQDLEKEYPLTSSRLARVQVWTSDRKHHYSAVMGAPEAVMDLCHLPKHDVEKVLGQVTELATSGFRMVGIAEGTISTKLPDDSHENSYTYLGLVCLHDPIRPEVASAIKQCQKAGIKVVMITGDYAGTAEAIARQVGLAEGDTVTGDELELIDHKKMGRHIEGISIFARIMPEQKLRIVDMFKSRDHVVVMTGDGVNDAPALKAAHIGIAMGEKGTDVAKEAAGIVLLKDSFASIAAGIRLGRRIFDNIRKAIGFTIAVHIPIIGIAAFSTVMGWPIILFPAHIAFLELVIDPACSVVFEAEEEEKDIMNRPPRSITEHLFSRETVRVSIAQGLQVLAFVIGVFAFYYYRGMEESTVRTMAFIMLVLGNLGLIFANRTWSHRWVDYLVFSNRTVWWLIGATTAMLAVIINLPLARDLFSFSSLSAGQVGICITLACTNLMILPIWRWILKDK